MVDALASGASVRKDVRVQVPPRAQLVGYKNLLPISGVGRIAPVN